MWCDRLQWPMYSENFIWYTHVMFFLVWFIRCELINFGLKGVRVKSISWMNYMLVIHCIHNNHKATKKLIELYKCVLHSFLFLNVLYCRVERIFFFILFENFWSKVVRLERQAKNCRFNSCIVNNPSSIRLMNLRSSHFQKSCMQPRPFIQYFCE